MTTTVISDTISSTATITPHFDVLPTNSYNKPKRVPSTLSMTTHSTNWLIC